jgi:heme-degrading monooxygenase HmoA
MQQNQQSSTKTHVGFATTPEPPYYAVIFTSQRTEGDHGYEAMAQAMFELALKQSGCLGAESVRDVCGLGITVAYFTDESAIHAWKQNSEHLVAQRLASSAGIPIMSCG